jgi:hypothetical protein
VSGYSNGTFIVVGCSHHAKRLRRDRYGANSRGSAG